MADKPYKVIEGDMLKILPTLAKNSFDACITDPPYHLESITKRFGKENSAPAKEGTDGSFARLSRGFMGQQWDGGDVAFRKETWEQVYRVLKNGAYLLAFGGSRTFHRMACAIEDAGFEIRDCIMWLYGSGFPKSLNVGLAIDKKLGCSDRGHRIAVANRHHPDGTLEPNGDNLPKYEGRTDKGKEWAGWGTCLKPSYEPIIVARKPLDGGVADNVLKWGVGGINIDECRVEFEDTPNPATNPKYRKNAGYKLPEKGQISNGAVSFTSSKNETNDLGRFPANVILTYDETDFEEVCGGMPDTKSGSELSYGSVRKQQPNNCYKLGFTQKEINDGQKAPDNYGDNGNACRYFYCAKASKKDRDEGLDLFNIVEKSAAERTNRKEGSAGINAYAGATGNARNFHPTVKPVELMQYLIRLVTPKGGNILEPFAGSGTTGKAAMFENRERNANYTITMCELTHDYIPIIEARCDYALNKYEYELIETVKEHNENGQLSLFDDLLGGEEND